MRIKVNDEMDERVKMVAEYTKGKLTKDSAIAIILLEDEIFEKNCTVELLKKGDLVAIYEGDKTKPYNSNKFVINAKHA